jgi:Zn-dependent alcohol dehydrogenase
VGEIKISPLELFVTQKAIMGAVYGFTSPRLQIPELLALYRRGEIKLNYADLEAGLNLRGVIVF